MKKTGANNSKPRSNVRSASVSSSRRTSPSKSTSASRKSSKKAKKSKPWIPVVIAASVLAVGAIAGGVLWKTGFFDKKYDITLADGSVVQMTENEIRTALSTDTFVDGIIIDGINVSGMTKENGLATVLANQPEAPIDIDIQLNLADEILPLDLSSLPVTNNANEIVDTAFNYLKITGSEDVATLLDIYAQREALKATPMNYNSAYTLQSEELSPLVHGVLDSYVHPAINADLGEFNVDRRFWDYTPSEEGYEVDIDKAVNDVKALLDNGTYNGIVDVDAEISYPELTTDMILSEFGMISSTSTRTTAVANRNHNISLAASKINGFVLQPGEQFSFNTVVGQRTVAAGFREAGVIGNGGAAEQGLGGGICQVSTMIYQSVIKADLKIIQRHPHMWPSSYAEVGTDAAVNYPDQDFVFENSSEYPVVIIAYWDEETSYITVELYGHLLPNGEYIEFHGTTSGRTSAEVQYVQNTTMPVGQTNQTRAPHDQYFGSSWTIRYDANGNEIERIDLPTTPYSRVDALIEVGTLQPDGTQAGFDATTGAVTPTYTEPEATEPAPSESAAPETPAETPAATEAPTEAPSGDPAPGGEA